MGRRRDILEGRNAVWLEELLARQDPNQVASTPPSQHTTSRDDSSTACHDLGPRRATCIDGRDSDP